LIYFALAAKLPSVGTVTPIAGVAFSLWGGKDDHQMYVTGFAGVILILLAVLMILGVVPVSPLIVGVMFLLVALGFAGPFVVRA
jgi:hypothetical protein